MTEIACTRENAPEFRALIAAWPELQSVVQDLQQQGFVQSMSALHVTLHGGQIWPISQDNMQPKGTL